jgi:hypothetical protein
MTRDVKVRLAAFAALCAGVGIQALVVADQDARDVGDRPRHVHVPQ